MTILKAFDYWFRKATLLVLACAVAAAPMYALSIPQHANAQGGAACLAGYAWGAVAGFFGFGAGAAGVTGGAAVASASPSGLPVKDTATNVILTGISLQLNAIYAMDAIAAGNTGSLTFKECVLDVLFWILKSFIIPQITAAIVDWINSGFEGTPSFIGNPQTFVLDLADRVAGEFILEAGLGFLCSPFQLQVQIDLALSYYMPAGGEDGTLACKITDVFENSVDAMASLTDFLAGTFEEGGFPAWFAVTMQPHNNPHGSYLNAQAEMSVRIRNKQGAEINLLGMGDGFLSIRDENNNVITPGQYISRELEDWTGAPLAQLEVADELDEIVGALFQVLVRELLSEGVAGASRGDFDRPSYLDQIRAEANDAGGENRNYVLAQKLYA
jgi:hypothetical protein